MKDRRKFKRWPISIPCTVESKGEKIIGKTRNVSLGGALITQANGAPPEGALVTVIFEAEEGPIRLKGKIMSKVIHTLWEVIEEGGIGSFGVKFEESTETVREKLMPLPLTSNSGEKYLMKALKNYFVKHSEQIFALLILISVAAINYLIPYKLVFLNFFFHPHSTWGLLPWIAQSTYGSCAHDLDRCHLCLLFPRHFHANFYGTRPVDECLDLVQFSNIDRGSGGATYPAFKDRHGGG